MNTLMYAKKLEEVGFSREQAEMTIGILNEVVESKLATKEDMKELRGEMRLLKAELKNELGKMMVGGIVIATTLVGAIIKFFV